MTSEEMERAIEFLLDHHAKVSADIERHSEQIGQLTVAVSALTGSVKVMQEQMEADRQETRYTISGMMTEMREGFNNLIVANEITRNLAEQATKLAIQTSHRVTNLEGR
jgi:hypothetical protein